MRIVHWDGVDETVGAEIAALSRQREEMLIVGPDTEVHCRWDGEEGSFEEGWAVEYLMRHHA